MARLDHLAARELARMLVVIGQAGFEVRLRHLHFAGEQGLDARVVVLAADRQPRRFLQQQGAQHDFVHRLLERIGGLLMMRQFLFDQGVVDLDAID